MVCLNSPATVRVDVAALGDSFTDAMTLPIADASLPGSDLSRALQFYLPDNQGMPDVALMLRNRLAQNALMRRFCEQRGISFLDTTDALTARFLSGDNVYFPDESHLNELGHAVVAAALAAHLTRKRGLGSQLAKPCPEALCAM